MHLIKPHFSNPKYLILGLIFFILPLRHYAQSVYLRHITDEEGLPSLSVYDVLEDRKGYIWLATDRGLYRYDGVRFKHYPSRNVRGNSMSMMEQDAQGRIWGITFAGSVWHTEGDSVKVFTPFEKSYKLSFPLLKIIDNKLYISSERNPIYVYDLSNNLKLDSISISNNQNMRLEPTWGTASVFSDNNRYLYFIEYLVGIARVDLKNNNKAVSVYNITEENSKITHNIRFSNGKGLLIISNENKENISIYTITNGKLDKYYPDILNKIEINKINNFFFDAQNNTYWLSTFNGAWHLDTAFRVINHYLPNIPVGSTIRDREGMMWFCTPYDGIYQLPSLKMKVVDIQTSVQKISFDGEKNVFLATKNGEIARFNIEKNKIDKYIKLPTASDWQYLSWIGDDVQKLVFSNVYISSTNNDLDKINKHTNVPVTDKAILYDKNKKIYYCATSYGIIKRNAAFEDLEHFDMRRFMNGAINKNGNNGKPEFWFGCSDGILIIDNDENTRFIKTPFAPLCYVPINQNKVLVGSDRIGLVMIENGEIVRKWEKKDGLLGKSVSKILTEGNNIFWIATEGGIQRFDLNKNTFQSVTRANNLRGSTVFDMLICGNNLWVTTSQGVQFFPKDFEHTPLIAPKIYIENVEIGENKWETPEKVTFFENETNIKITFTGISFFSGSRFSYQYRIAELDTVWVSTSSTDNFVRYQSLPSGNYTFEVKLVTEDGRESNIKTLPLSIRMIFWKQWWFYAIAAIILGFGLTVYFLRLIKRLNERNLFEQKATNAELERTRAEEAYRRAQLAALKVQMNPHFLFNALNSIQAFIFLNDKNAANSYLGKFSDLMRRTLDMSQRDTILLADEVKMLELYLTLEAMRFRNELNFAITIADSNLTENTMLPPLLIQPYVENAIKHGLASKKENRQVTVHFSVENEKTLKCTIIDNGIGRAKAEELKKQRSSSHLSFSTSASEQRLALLNTARTEKINVKYTDLYNENGESIGTQVDIFIPTEIYAE